MQRNAQLRQSRPQAQSVPIAKLAELQTAEQLYDVLSARFVRGDVDAAQAEIRSRRSSADVLHAQIAAAPRMIFDHQVIAISTRRYANAGRAVDSRDHVIDRLGIAQINHRGRAAP